MIRKRVLIADDHQIFLDGLEHILEPEYEVVGKASNGEELVSLTRHHDPDLIVTDYAMRGLDGVGAVSELAKQARRAKIVILTTHEDADSASEAIGNGVRGYVLKSSASSELLTALREALNGRTWISPTVAGQVVERLRSGVKSNAKDETSEKDIAQQLSGRQRRIIAQIATGKIAKEIALGLGISQKTVEYHKYKVMRLLGIQSTAELVRFAVRNNLDR